MARYTQPRKTWFYTDDFKIKAVKLSNRTDIQVQEVAAALDIHPFMLSRWRKEYREGKLQGDNQRRLGVMRQRKAPSPQQMSELALLRKENEKLKKENDLLNKVATVSRGTTSERYRFVEEHGQRLGVSYLCGWLKVSRSGYYDWCKRPESDHRKSDQTLTQKIVAIHQSSRGVYGSPPDT